MSTDYMQAPEVEEIAKDLIPEHHGHLQHVTILYVFRTKAQKQAGKEVWGKARKVGGLNAFLVRDALRDSGPDVSLRTASGAVDTTTGKLADLTRKLADEPDEFFVLEIAHDIWRFLSDEAKRALVDHELCHFTTEFDDEGNNKLAIAPHDIEEFAEVVRRHGLWRDDIKHFMVQATQLELIPVGGAEGEPQAGA